MSEHSRYEDWNDLTHEKYFTNADFRAAGRENDKLWKKLTDMANEKEFIWTDKSVAEACYWIGLKINGTEDIKKQIPSLIEKYKENKNQEQQKQYPEGIISVKHMGMTDGDVLKEYEIEPVHKFVGGHYQTWCKNRLELGGCIIWSVQNGNEVLTVGDTVKFRYGEEFKIETLKIQDGAIFACTENETIRYLVHPNNLRKVVHQPLFQISGKDVYEGDTYYRIHLGAANINGIFKYEKGTSSFYNPDIYKYFLSEKEAQQWIEENRPQYSKAQLRECFNYSKAKTTMQFGKDNLKDFIHSEYTFEDYEKYLSLPENKTP